MKKSDKDALYIALFLLIVFALDMTIIYGLLWKGQANFPELIKHLKS
jgi:hypothetical protein